MAQEGDNGQADDFLRLFDEAISLKRQIAALTSDLNDTFKEAKEAGHNVRAMKRAMKESEMSGAQREADDTDYRQMMAWLGKPVGLSAIGASMPSEPLMTEHERQEHDAAGYAVGKMGGKRASNPWTPGTLPYAAHDGGWLRGAEERLDVERRAAAPATQQTTP